MKRAKKAIKKAAKSAVQMFTAWSYSRWKDHSTCPQYAYWKHILKKPEGPKPPAMLRGSEIHTDGELFLRGTKKKLPASFARFKKELADLRKARAIPEGKWAVTNKWTQADFFDWARAWCRMVLDAHHMAKKKQASVIDFKTGKMYPDDHADQMELYAVGAFAHYPTADEVKVSLWYVDQPRGKDNPTVKVFKRSEAPKIQKKWEGRVIPMLTDKRFPPKANFTCGRCAYSQRKGGECKY